MVFGLESSGPQLGEVPHGSVLQVASWSEMALSTPIQIVNLYISKAVDQVDQAWRSVHLGPWICLVGGRI